MHSTPVREDGELDGVPLHQLVLVPLAAQLYPHVAVARHLLAVVHSQSQNLANLAYKVLLLDNPDCAEGKPVCALARSILVFRCLSES